jgi:hypothetical protein
VLQERYAVELGELLGRAEPARPARGEHEARDHAATLARLARHLVDAPARVRQPPAGAPAPQRDDLAHDRQRRLLRRQRAKVEADRRGEPPELVVL